ncbi:hypothetical protein C7B65_25575 [Phormidesmis priestleyi ULC007]|uniref:Uncharacterized protein n=1 Tax=Phormidesmis priestleyi ULC007 TaxID=1920490 RepID=A0A2T1D3A1_9CYAN|nr:hypothetical protein [Phormidesmis priestleyi]PSB14936.1 hypothetical protein C7B65_25575 [Phormidesmis priestleyi ULC007]PZO45930.1 MAG: hypothetical protein DCF14_24275 [Phormidesmis priestleyi]
MSEYDGCKPIYQVERSLLVLSAKSRNSDDRCLAKNRHLQKISNRYASSHKSTMSNKPETQFLPRSAEAPTTLDSLTSYDRAFNFEQWAQQVRPQLIAALNKRGTK